MTATSTGRGMMMGQPMSSGMGSMMMMPAMGMMPSMMNGMGMGRSMPSMMMVPRCTMKMEKMPKGMAVMCTCEDQTAAMMMQNLCMMLQGGMCSMGVMMNGMTCCCYGMGMMGMCKMEMTEMGCRMTCTSGDANCAKMIQACCDCMMNCMSMPGCTCCMMMNGMPVCCSMMM
jgi:hypothetical protein